MKTVVHLPVRRTVPSVPEPVDQVALPPQLPGSPTGGFPIQTLLPVLGAVSSMTMMLVSRGSNPVFMLVGALVFVVALVSGLAMVFTQRSRANRTRQFNRERYLDYLEETRTDLRERADQVRTTALVCDPSPQVLPQILADPARVWERRVGDPDFLRIRIGVGTVPWFGLATPKNTNPDQPVDPLLLAEASEVARVANVVDDMPVWVEVGSSSDVALVGRAEDTTAAGRALVAQIITHHNPDDVRLAIVVPPDRADQWPAVNLPPHIHIPHQTTDIPQVLVCADADGLSRLLAQDLSARVRRVAARRHTGTTIRSFSENSHLIVIMDEHGHPAQPLLLPEEGYTCADLGITVVHLVDKSLDEPSRLDIRVTLDSDGGVVVDDLRPNTDRPCVSGRVDQVSPALFETVMRQVAPLTLTSTEAQQAGQTPQVVSALKLLGIDDLDTFTTTLGWQPRPVQDFLRVPIGTDDYGALVLLDLKQAAEAGMGPHGICVGATGSGKSELLRTLVLGLAATHSPEDLSMILIDYKGGAAFAPFASLSHVAGLMDNLADDPQLTRRARESVAGEVRRRQELLKNANSAASISHYRAMRVENPAMPPMPHLLLVIDEFGELLTSEPDFAALLLQIGRIGRSIGVHLLLASQRLESGMLRGLDTYLSYWIGMRTFSEAESRAVLDTPDAFTLPASPGWGYLKVDTSTYTRFRSGYVSSPIPTDPNPELVDINDQPQPVQLVPLYPVEETVHTTLVEEVTSPDVGRLLVDEVVERLATPMHAPPVWLPPLQPRVTLGSVLSSPDPANTDLSVAIGLLDDPGKQRQTPWLVDLTARGGHLAVIGAPQTGRSTFLRTFAVSLALTHTPKQISIYGIDLTGGGLDRLEGFPHVGGVATRADRTRLNRVFEELRSMTTHREEVFRNHRIDSPAALRAAHARGEITELVAPDVIVLIDGVEPVRNEFEHLDPMFTELLQRGGTFGIHMVLAMTRWNELRANTQALIGQRFELRLNDPAESTISRPSADVLKTAGPGRALTQDKLYGQIALPILDEVDDDAHIGDTITSLARRVTAAWTGPAAAPIRLLPEDFDPAELPNQFDEPDLIPYALRQDTFQPVCFDPDLDQHLLVFGDTRCGKTTLLNGLAQQFVKRLSPDHLVFAVIDPRNTLANHIPDDYLGGHATTTADAIGLCSAVAEELTHRQSDPTAPRPRIVVLVDDYDIISAGGTHPIQPLLPFLPSARDLRLHIILTRPVTGSGRAVFEETIQAIRDTGGTGLLMDGDRSEGAVFPKVYPEAFPPGRGKLIRRGQGPRVIQIAHFTQGAPHAT